MRRRTLLATVGVGLSAGCSEAIPLLDSEHTATDTAPQSPDSTPESAPTDTADPTDTAEPTATTEETDTQRPAERRGARVIAKARSQLGSAYENYVAFAETQDPTLLDVTVSTAVTFSKVTSPVASARETLEKLPYNASGEQIEAARGLRGVAAFLDQGVRCQDDLRRAHSEFDYVVGRLYTSQSGLVSESLGRIRDRQAAAAEHLDTVRSDSATEDTAAFDPIDAETYDAKVAQLQVAVDAFATLPDALARIKRGLDAFRHGSSAYLSEEYLEARRTFPTAETELRSAADTLSGLDTPYSMTAAVADLAAVSDALAKAAVDLEVAADTGSRGEDRNRNAAFADAKDHLRSSSVAVERLDVVERLLEK